METAAERQGSVRFWALGAACILLSAGAAFSYLHSMGYGIAAGDLIGLQGRAGDVVYAQRWAMLWFTTAVCCLGLSSLSGALATSVYEESARVPRFIARLILALAVSFALAVLMGFAFYAIVTASHHSVMR